MVLVDYRGRKHVAIVRRVLQYSVELEIPEWARHPEVDYSKRRIRVRRVGNDA